MQLRVYRIPVVCKNCKKVVKHIQKPCSNPYEVADIMERCELCKSVNRR